MSKYLILVAAAWNDEKKSDAAHEPECSHVE